MQKKLLTVAVAGALALPVAAIADVTVYGTIDTGIRNISKLHTPGNAAGTSDSVLDLANNTRTTNRWGLKGSEDLGGGLMANFTLEGQYASDSGGGPGSAAGVGNQGLFQRKSIVGLSKGGMSVDLGRDYTVNFKSQGIYDPMSYTYTGITPTAGTNVAGTRSSNMITAGFRFGTGGIRVDYALGEVLDNTPPATPSPQKNDRLGLMGDFVFGPVTVTAAYSQIEGSYTIPTAVRLAAASGGVVLPSTAQPVDTNTMNFGAVYKMGAFTFRAGYSSTEDKGTGAFSGSKHESPMLMFGVQYAISPTLNGRFGYYDTENEYTAPGLGTDSTKEKLFIVALDYYLSKRTTAYVVFDRVTLDETGEFVALFSSAGSRLDGSTGIGVGIAHAF